MSEDVNQQYEGLYEKSTQEMVKILIQGQEKAFEASKLAAVEIEKAVEVLVLQLQKYPSGRIGFAGAGTSGRLAVGEMAELPPTFGWPYERLISLIAGGNAATQMERSHAEDDIASAEELILQHDICEKDSIIAVAASGTTSFTCHLIAKAKERGALTISISNHENAPLASLADYNILAKTGAELLSGSTRLAAGTAQKIILNTLTTATMMRLGLVYKGRMIAMKPTNQKLVKRAENMIMTLCEVDVLTARKCLLEANNHLPTALLMAFGCSFKEAQKLLEKNHHHFPNALQYHVQQCE